MPALLQYDFFMVSFYPVATEDTCSSSAKTSAIHKEKFNVPLSSDDHNDLLNFVKHLKTSTGLADLTKSKCLGGNPEVTIAFSIFPLTDVQKANSFLQEPFKNTRNFEISIKRANLQSIY